MALSSGPAGAGYSRGKGSNDLPQHIGKNAQFRQEAAQQSPN